jgi:hypothetical protein
MRKLFTILALLGLAVGTTALSAHADGVDYSVSGAFGAISGFPSTGQSNPGDSFTFTFSVSSTALGSSPIGIGMSPGIPISFDYTDVTTPSFSQSGSGTVNFFTAGDGGLFGVTFTGLDGNVFMLELFGLGCLDTPPTATCVGGFTDGTPPTLTTGGPFGVDPVSFLGEFAADGTPIGGDGIVDGTVTATPTSSTVPEPSSLLLLGSGFLALSGFARKRLSVHFN